MWRALTFNAFSRNNWDILKNSREAIIKIYSIFIPIFYDLSVSTAIICDFNLVDPLNADSGLSSSKSTSRYLILQLISSNLCFRLIICLWFVALLVGVFTITCNLWHCLQAFSRMLATCGDASWRFRRYKIGLWNKIGLSCYAAHSNLNEVSGFQRRRSCPRKEPGWKVCSGKNLALHLNVPISYTI